MPVTTSTAQKSALLSLLLSVGACGVDATRVPVGAVDAGDVLVDANPAPAVDAFVIECEAPDFTLILDRTGSMSRRPDGTSPPNTITGANESKWAIAVSVLENLTAMRQSNLRFGLVLFPRDPEGAGGKDCSNLDTWLTQYLPPQSNDPVCLPAESLVLPALNTASEIDLAIDRDTTGLCTYTPIGAGFEAAKIDLASVRDGLRDQWAVLITDGADTCDLRPGYTTNSLTSADSLRDDDVKILVVGFDGSGAGIDSEHLNHLACAGGTAPSFDTNCLLLGGHYRAVDATNGPRLFLLAEDALSLGQALEAATADICCGCVD